MTSNAENILYVILGLGLAAALATLIILVRKHNARRGWQGIVMSIDSRMENDANGMSAKYVTINVLCTNANVKLIRLQEMAFQMSYPGLKVGDRMVKPPGETVARKA